MEYLSATQLSRSIANRDMSCVELMSYTLNRIESLNPDFNAIVALDDIESLMNQATQADAALERGEYWGWMHGMPHAVKDLADLRGFITSSGSPIYADRVATEDSIFVERLRAQGAIFVGKTNVPEFGLGSQSYNRVYGSTKNAFDVNLTAGGSSGGAAVGLATGMLPVADGSDMMGSLRNPAAFNNVVGFRPGLGRIPRAKFDLFFSQLSTDGPMGRTIEDVISLFTTMAGMDKRAPLSTQVPIRSPNGFSAAHLDNVGIGWLADYNGYLAMEPGVLSLCEASLKHLESAGATVEQISIDFPKDQLWQAWLTLRSGQFSNTYKVLYADPGSRELLKPELIWEIERGSGVTAAELYNASGVRSDWYRTVNSAFEQWDLLALPSAQVFPFPVEQHWPQQVDDKNMDTYHRWMEVTIGGTLSSCPVISLPAGLDESGRPTGIQFIAPLGEDEKLLEFALAYEEVNPWHGHYA